MSDHLDVDPRVGAVLTAAAAPAEAPLPGEAEARAAFRRAHRHERRPRLFRPAEHLKLFAVAVSGGVVVVSGVAAAATGTLPLVGSSHSHHGQAPKTDPAGGTRPSHAQRTADPGAGTSANTRKGHGSTISQLAKSTSPTDVPKGRTICTAASTGKCQAGQHGKAADPTHGKAGQHGKAGLHGKAGQHGKAGNPTHGKSGDMNTGPNGPPARHGPVTN